MAEYTKISQFNDKIFESPDGGRTVYQRTIGSTVRTLVAQNMTRRTDIMEQLKYNINYSDFIDLMRLAETNPTLKESLDNLLTTYNLIRNHE